MIYSLTSLSQSKKKWIVLLNFMFISAAPCLAQENTRFERITVNEGLAQSDVKCMVQDTFGFLWIGTRDGLNKYDGLEFSRFGRKKNDSTSLQFNQILDLQIDQSGNIWIGSIGGISIYNYRTDNFHNFFPTNAELQGIEVNHILLTGKHTALLSTNKGLINFDQEQRKFFAHPDSIVFKDTNIYYACQSEHGFWVATDKGAFMKPSIQSDWIRLLENSSVYDIDADANGSVYLSTSKGLFTYDQEKKIIAQIVIPVGSVTEVMRMRNGDLWVSSNKVIVLDKNDALKHVLAHDKFNNYSLSEDRARVLFQTRDDVIWVGTFGYGLNRFNPEWTKFSYLNERTSIPLSGNYVSAIFTWDDTTVWVGTSRGLDVINLKTKSAKHFSNREDLFRIVKIVGDNKKRIWLATSDGFMLNSWNTLVPKNASLKSICDFAEWDNTHLILASMNQGIYLFDRDTDRTTVFIPASNLPEEVSCLLVEEDHLWIGCKDGLKLYSRKGKLVKHFKADQLPGSLQASFIKSLYRDSHGKLWVGTWGGGLSMLNPQDSTFTTYDVNSGLPNNVVYGILENDSGILLLSTNLGISAFDPHDLEFRNFDFSDGLQSNEFNTGAYFKSVGGMMYLGGVNGLNFFKPEEILVHDPVASILPTFITVNNKALAFGDRDSVQNVLMIDRIQLKWKENDVGIKFSAIDFKHSKKYDFQYTIKDTTWHDIGNRRSLELIDLPNGLHKIQVRARKPGSGWSLPMLLLTVDIVPPVWQRTWFKILGVLTLLILIFAAYKFKTARLKRANAILNKLVSERTKEIQSQNEEIASQNDQLHELNQELQAFSYSVSHDLRAPLRAIIGYSKILEEDSIEKLDDSEKRALNAVQQNATRMNNLVNALLEFSKLGRQELRKTKVDTLQLLKGILEGMNVSTEHKTEFKVGALPSVWADNNLITQVWINLISNAIKYSAKKEVPVVEIGSYPEENTIVFYVKDNGAGFDMKYADRLFGVFQRLHHNDEFEGTGVGLALVHRIVVRHGGSAWAEAKVDEGATFYFSLPD